MWLKNEKGRKCIQPHEEKRKGNLFFEQSRKRVPPVDDAEKLRHKLDHHIMMEDMRDLVTYNVVQILPVRI